MGISLTYAFGRAGRHLRAIVTPARTFISAQRSTLPNNPAIDFLFMQSKAIDHVLFHVFYSEPEDECYMLHKKYLPYLLEVPECGFRRMSLAYASALIVGLPTQPKSEADCQLIAGALHTLSHLYDGSEPASHWLKLAYSRSDEGINASLLADIAKVLRISPSNQHAFAFDWLALLPLINRTTEIMQRIG